ncbi:4-phosphoerythronate dehydrogenase PdxB [Pseudomonas matsuisoli]|uniref:Erythronate-4-phosphate dehydrogenase n=1 Tax=Pseudomonas matsuisoli TaxID=1515666 RepID=A0A917V083_9PSED|nr:4-phosphoerythronate dehydrogenase PdxB [Pseudomonas matsuisoli]GGK06272.1 erythronate-4-phosphate dehydrogenase [Pseudomonas matsuisoli]
MRIVADENIPLVETFFGSFGEIVRYPGRLIKPDDLKGADALLVRSVTTVDEALLAQSTVRFVGTCTIGTDHIDKNYCADAGITWASAPGCNARGVVDYVLSTVLTLAERTDTDPAEQVYGIVGVGEVGGRLWHVLKGLGWKVLVCDPLKADVLGGDHTPLDVLLARCDVISLHTPLIRHGEHATHGLMSAARIEGLKPGTWLINASRGEVVDGAALRARLQRDDDLQVALDVWESEPAIDPALALRCAIATPHIAGYSLEGKLRGTAQIYAAFCRFLGQPATLSLEDVMPRPWLSLRLAADTPLDVALRMTCRAVYDPRDDDAMFRNTLGLPAEERKRAFDRLRRDYRVRRELEGLKVELTGAHASGDVGLGELLSALGVHWRRE